MIVACIYRHALHRGARDAEAPEPARNAPRDSRQHLSLRASTEKPQLQVGCPAPTPGRRAMLLDSSFLSPTRDIHWHDGHEININVPVKVIFFEKMYI
jgi:hypothetical protein